MYFAFALLYRLVPFLPAHFKMSLTAMMLPWKLQCAAQKTGPVFHDACDVWSAGGGFGYNNTLLADCRSVLVDGLVSLPQATLKPSCLSGVLLLFWTQSGLVCTMLQKVKSAQVDCPRSVNVHTLAPVQTNINPRCHGHRNTPPPLLFWKISKCQTQVEHNMPMHFCSLGATSWQ